MFKETLTEHDDVIGLVCEGKLTEADFKKMHALLHERLGTTDNPGLVLDLTSFEGYEEPSAILEVLKIDTTRERFLSHSGCRRTQMDGMGRTGGQPTDGLRDAVVRIQRYRVRTCVGA
jgi:hypothetical protein